MHQAVFLRFGVALVLGILVGLEREYAQDRVHGEDYAGVRTFALIGLLGAMAAFAAEQTQSVWAFVAVLGLLGLLVLIAYRVTTRDGDVGLTTEMAILVTALCGAFCYWDQMPLAIAIAVSTTVLLSLKLELHRFANIITREDVFATLKFAVVTAIVLPVLPDKPLAGPPLDVLIPHDIWLMVVLISAMSFAGYVLIKTVGARRGISLTGLLGGLASSTALTLSMTERSRQRGTDLGRPLAQAIMLAWTVMYGRLMIEVGVVSHGLLIGLWWPIGAAALVGVGYGAYLFFAQRTDEQQDADFHNPFDLSTALRFGALYAVILLGSRLAQTYLGDTGLYISSVVGGLADVDAISLSVAQLHSAAGGPTTQAASQAILLAAMSNTLAKGLMVMFGGSAALRKALWPGLILMLAAGLGVGLLL